MGRPPAVMVAVTENDIPQLRELLRNIPVATLISLQEPLPLFHMAALIGSAEAVPLLVAAGLPISAADARLPACTQEQEQLVTDIWSFSLFMSDHTQPAALMIAAERGHCATATALLAAGADASATDARGLNAVVVAIAGAGKEDDLLPLVQQLLAAGAALDLPAVHAIWEDLGEAFDNDLHFRGQLLQLLLQHLGEPLAAGQLRVSDNVHLQSALLLAVHLDDLEVFQQLHRLAVAWLSDDQLTEVYEDIVDRAFVRYTWGSSGLAILQSLLQRGAAASSVGAASHSDSLFLSDLKRRLPPALEEAEGESDEFAMLLLRAARHMTCYPDVVLAATGGYLLLFEAEVDDLPQPPMPDHLQGSYQYPCYIHKALLACARGHFSELSFKDLHAIEALVAAGFPPMVYENVMVQLDHRQPAVLHLRYDPVEEDPSFQITGRSRYLWLAVTQPAWCPRVHARFPPAFKQAACTLLLAVQRGTAAEATAAAVCSAADPSKPASSSSSCTDGSSCGSGANASSGEAPSWVQVLAGLPVPLVLHILGLAAYPISAWGEREAE